MAEYAALFSAVVDNNMKVVNDIDALQIHYKVLPEDIRWEMKLCLNFDLISVVGPTDEIERLEANDQPTKILEKVLEELR